MINLNSSYIIIQQNLYHVNIINSAVRAIIRVKEILMKVIMNMGANVFIIILSIVKKLRIIIEISNRSKIIMINQMKKKCHQNSKKYIPFYSEY